MALRYVISNAVRSPNRLGYLVLREVRSVEVQHHLITSPKKTVLQANTF